MKQEEKAKAYDEVLERARKIHEYSSDLAEIKRMEYIFPELAESEDERIRKYLIDCVTRTIPEADAFKEISKEQILAWLEKQGQVKESEIPHPIKETSKENDNSLTNKAWSEIQNGIILDGVVYELTTGFPDNKLSLCGNCELNEKCIEFDGSLCYFFADNFRKVFHKVKMERKL